MSATAVTPSAGLSARLPVQPLGQFAQRVRVARGCSIAVGLAVRLVVDYDGIVRLGIDKSGSIGTARHGDGVLVLTFARRDTTREPRFRLSDAIDIRLRWVHLRGMPALLSSSPRRSPQAGCGTPAAVCAVAECARLSLI